MTIETSVKSRKRKHVDYKELDGESEAKEEDEEGVVEEVSFGPQQTLAEAEAEDLDDLISIASEATEIVFDSRTGRPIRYLRPSFGSPADHDSNREHDDDNYSYLIDGLVKVSRSMMLEGDPDLFRDLTRIHAIVKHRVRIDDMVPWAGIGGDSTRLRAFGFLGKTALERLDRQSAVRLYAPEKQGKDALLDERANRKAICVLNRTRERVLGAGRNKAKRRKKRAAPAPTHTVNPTLVADKLCAAILTDKGGSENDDNCYLNPSVLNSKELIAYQTNLHNGAKHLAAHLDAPLHEGFGKVIVTVAIRGSATILLIGKAGNENENDNAENDIEEQDESSDLNLQPSWKFHLEEGEAYVLSGNVRNVCLHAVLANDDSSGGGRESLNLRFGIHTIKEAEHDIKRHWPDLW